MSAGAKNLYVVISANAATFRGEMVAASASVREFGHSVSDVAAKNTDFRNVLGKTAMVVGGALVAGIAAGVVANVRLQRSMENVATISSTVKKNIGDYTQQVIDMSTRVPQSAETLADGLYDIVSSGLDGAQAMQVLEVSAKAASAGLTDTATSSRAIMSVLNAYGLSASHAGDVSDILFQTVNKGVISFEQLANEIGLVVPTAAAAGVSFDEVGSALATMTLSGLNASESATSLNQLLTKLLAPSMSLSGVYQDLGWSSGYAALSTMGLHKVIQKLSKSQGDAADTAIDLFKDIRAARGYMALTAASGHNYAASYDAISNAVARAQAAQKAYAIQSQSDSQKWQLIRNQLVAFGMELASGLMPVFSMLTGGIHDFTSMLDAIPGPAKTVLAIFALLGGTALLLLGGFVKARAAAQTLAEGLLAVGVTAEGASVAARNMMIAMGVVGVALVAATAVYGAYSRSKAEAAQVTQDFVQALQQEQNGVKNAAIDDLVAKMVNDGSLKKLQTIGFTTKQVVDGMMGNVADYNKMSNAVQPVQYYSGGGTLTVDQFKDVRESIEKYHDSMGHAVEIVKEQQAAQQDLTTANAQAASGQEALSQQIHETKNGVQQLVPDLTNLSKTLTSVVDPSTALQNSMKKNTSSLSDFMAEMEKEIRAGRQFSRNLAILASRGRTDLVDQFEQLGPQAAGALSDAAHASNKVLDRLSGDFRASGRLSSDNYVGALGIGMQILPSIASNAGGQTVKALAAAFTNGNIAEIMQVLRNLKSMLEGLPVEKKIDIVIATHHTSTGGGGVPAPAPNGPPVPSMQANGGVWNGRVRAFADGGYGSNGRYYSRMSQIVGGGTNILWGEKETGWEAYISGKPSQVARNRAVWAEAGRRLGMEPGRRGVGAELAHRGGRGQTVRHVVDVRVTGELDMEKSQTQLRAVATQAAQDEINENSVFWQEME